jgi:hypothetical protein
MPSANLNQFHNQVMPDEALQEQLKAATNPGSLSELEIEAAIAGECEEIEDSLLSAIVGGGGGYKMMTAMGSITTETTDLPYYSSGKKGPKIFDKFP